MDLLLAGEVSENLKHSSFGGCRIGGLVVKQGSPIYPLQKPGIQSWGDEGPRQPSIPVGDSVWWW